MVPLYYFMQDQQKTSIDFKKVRENGKMVRKSQLLATEKYNKKAYDNIRLRVKTGKKYIIEEYAKQNGFSINSYINIAIDRQLEKDGYKPIKESKEEQ